MRKASCQSNFACAVCCYISNAICCCPLPVGILHGLSISSELHIIGFDYETCRGLARCDSLLDIQIGGSSVILIGKCSIYSPNTILIFNTEFITSNTVRFTVVNYFSLKLAVSGILDVYRKGVYRIIVGNICNGIYIIFPNLIVIGPRNRISYAIKIPSTFFFIRHSGSA